MRRKRYNLRYLVERQATARGFTPWGYISPRMNIACCDCGLVHEHRYRMSPGGLQHKVRRHEGKTAEYRATRKVRAKLRKLAKHVP